MSDADIANFQSLTGADADTAKFYIEAAGGDISVAVSRFFDNAGGGSPGGSPAPQSGPRTLGGGSVPSQYVASPSPPPTSSTSGGGGGGRSGGIATLSDVGGSGASGGDGKHNEYYSGGKSSGIAVQGGKDDPNELVSSLFDNAKKHGAVDAAHATREAEEPNTFSGAGYRLGSTPGASRPLPATVAAPPPKEKTVKLEFWKEGFTVDSGPLRRYDDPANATFLADINKGIAPAEIHPPNPMTKIAIDMVDRKHEEYKEPPKPAVVAFSGEGRALGGPAVPAAAAVTTAATTEPEPMAIDSSLPSTSIQIRLHDGTRLVSNFNLTATVGDLYDFVARAAPLPAGTQFELREPMPPNPLTDKSLTIEAAGLDNASVVQRLT